MSKSKLNKVQGDPSIHKPKAPSVPETKSKYLHHSHNSQPISKTRKKSHLGGVVQRAAPVFLSVCFLSVCLLFHHLGGSPLRGAQVRILQVIIGISFFLSFLSLFPSPLVTFSELHTPLPQGALRLLSCLQSDDHIRS
jgi:hypothetical protein